MDDQQAYLLNGLLTRQFGLGRIVRFRPIHRGRQAECYELFTTSEKEYLAQLFSPTFSATHLNFVASTVNTLDANRFSVMPILPDKSSRFVTEGPQNRHMLVTLAPEGSALKPLEYSEQDIAQVGLRLAWMHNLLKEQLPTPSTPLTTAQQLQSAFASSTSHTTPIPLPPGRKLDDLIGLAGLNTVHGWTHGDISPAALLHDGDRQLRAVTDWALLHWGCPLEDLVDAFLFLSINDKGILDRRRGKALLEAYDSLSPLKQMPWTPIVACWSAQRLISEPQRPLDMQTLAPVLTSPERVAMAIASCL